MDAATALRVIAEAAGAAGDRVEWSYHAESEEMPDEGVTRLDVLFALASATAAHAQNDEGTRWKLYGPIISGELLAVVVAIKRSGVIVIVTVHQPP